MTVNGADFSHWNITLGDLDSYDFVFHKATQGNKLVDSQYRERATMFRNRGLVFGAYLFLSPGIPPEQQVDHFESVADIQPGDIVALDFEDDGAWHVMTNLYLSQVANETMTHLHDRYPNNRIVLYCNRTAWRTIVQAYSVDVIDGLWIASPGVIPQMPWVFWQYGSGSVDYDRGNFTTRDDLHRWVLMDAPSAGRHQQQLLLNG